MVGKAAGPSTLTISKVTTFDPEGDQAENDRSVGSATDGNTATAWTTEAYFNPTTAPKHGVGLVLGLTGTARVAAVDIVSPDSGWDVQIYVAPESGSTLAGWGTVRAAGSNLSGTADLRLGTQPPGQFVLIWLTRLPQSAEASPDGKPRFVGRIAEVSVRGTSI